MTFHRMGRLISACVFGASTLGTALMASIAPATCFAQIQHVITINVANSIANQGPRCSLLQATASCWTTIDDAFNIISNPHWQQSAASKATHVRVHLPTGTIRIDSPIDIHWSKAHAPNLKLSIVGGGKATISGSFPLPDWRPANEVYKGDSRISEDRIGALFFADLRKYWGIIGGPFQPRGYGIEPSAQQTQLIQHGKSLQIASWPDAGWGTIDSLGAPSDRKLFRISNPNPLWSKEPDLVAHGFWMHDWAAQAYRVSFSSTDPRNGTLVGSGSPYGIRAGQRIRIENAASELTRAGEWYFDKVRRGILYWPAADNDWKSTVEVSIAPTLIRVKDSANVTLDGVNFSNSRGTAIQVRGSSDIKILNSQISNSGGRAANFEDTIRSGIRDSTIIDSGQGAILLAGGDRNDLTAAGNFVENCRILRFSTSIYTDGFGVLIRGVGNTVSKSHFSDAPHTAVNFSGNDHRITGNTFERVVQETSDAGAVYIGRDYTARGTEISRNLFIDIQPYAKDRDVKGVYIDDQSSGILISNNVFSNVQQPVFISGGRDNLIRGNTFINSRPFFHLDARGINAPESLDPSQTLQKRLKAVPYQGTIYAKYPHLASILEDDFGYPKYNVVEDNYILDSGQPRIAPRAATGVSIRNNREIGYSDFKQPGKSVPRRTIIDFELNEMLRHSPP